MFFAENAEKGFFGMKQLKRLTSILLVLGIVLGLMPLSAFAAEPANTAKKPFTEEVDGNTYNLYAA